MYRARHAHLWDTDEVSAHAQNLPRGADLPSSWLQAQIRRRRAWAGSAGEVSRRRLRIAQCARSCCRGLSGEHAAHDIALGAYRRILAPPGTVPPRESTRAGRSVCVID